jgi:hypothetical protein
MVGARSAAVWTWPVVVVCAILHPAAQSREAREPLSLPLDGPTCDASQIDADSYALATRAQAHIVTEDRLSWWDGFNVGTAFEALHDLNASSTWAAERALQLDRRNLLAHGLLARQYVVVGEHAEHAEAMWRTTLDRGGAIVWTATLYDVDAKSYFVVAFDREALRVYRFGELAGPYDTHLGLPVFPGPERDRFWRAWAGCLDEAARPEAIVAWGDVREIKAGNWVLWFKLTRTITVSSDRGKRRGIDEIKVNLHGATGSVEVHASRDPVDPSRVDGRTMGIGPLAYQERIRRTLVKFVDPKGRIALPKASRSAGW